MTVKGVETKAQLRLYWKKKILQIPLIRRIEASDQLAKYPFPKGIIASFASFREEVDTKPLNQFLAAKQSLALPKIENDKLSFYLVKDLDKELSPSSLGFLEPIPALCKKAPRLDVILVPGLAFDKKYHRLGYGKGHYDKFLFKNTAVSIGIGFKEQLADPLPYESHDVRLTELLLL